MDLMCLSAFDFHQRIPVKVSIQLGAHCLHSVFFRNTSGITDSKDMWSKISGQDANLRQLSQSFKNLNCQPGKQAQIKKCQVGMMS